MIHSITVPSGVLASLLLFWLLAEAQIGLGHVQARLQGGKEGYWL